MPIPATDAAGRLMAKTAARAEQSQRDAALHKAANSPSLRISILKKLIAEAEDAYRQATPEGRKKLQPELAALKAELGKLGGRGHAATSIDDDETPEAIDLSHSPAGGFSKWLDRQLTKS